MNETYIKSILTASDSERSELERLFTATRQEIDDRPWLRCEPIFVPTLDGRIRALHGRTDDTDSRPIVFVPGWGTTPAGFTATFEVLNGRADWYYVETREKGSSILDRDVARLGMDEMAADVAAVIEHVAAEDFVLIGTCWGSAVILHGLARGIIDAPTIVVSDPMHQLWAPAWVRRLLIPIAPEFLVDLLRKPITAVALRNMPEGPQRRRALDFIENAVIWKWKRAAVGCRMFNLFEELDSIHQTVVVTNGASDVIHVNENYPKIAAQLKSGRFLYLETDEANRERLLGVLALEYAAVSSDKVVPARLDQFERDVTPLRDTCRFE